MLGLEQPGPAVTAIAPAGSTASADCPGATNSLPLSPGRHKAVAVHSALIPLLTVFWLASTLLRFSVAMFMTSPTILTDELTYWSLARNFHHGLHFFAYNLRFDSPAQLYSIFLSPLFGAVDSSVVYVLVKLASSLMFCSVVFPAYFLARELLAESEALMVALLSLLVPGGIYTATVMAENLYYPMFVLSAWLTYRALCRGRLRDGVFAGTAFAVGYFVKPHLLFLIAGYGVAVALWFFSRLVAAPSVKLGVQDELPGLLRRCVPFVVFAFGLPVRFLETAGYTHSLVVVIFGEGYVGTVQLANHRIPWNSFVTSGTWLLMVLLVSTAWLPVLAMIESVLVWKRFNQAQRWFWVLSACTAAVFLVMITRHNVLNDGILRTHERYIFQLAPLFFTWYFVARRQLPVRWLPITGAVVVLVVSVAIARSSHLLTWNLSSDSPTLSGVFWMHLRYPNSGWIIVAALLGGGLLCLAAPLVTRKPHLFLIAWALFLIGANAGWYGLRLKFVKPEVKRINDVAMYLKTTVPRSDAVGLLEDGADRRVGWYGNFWLSQPFYFYGWKQPGEGFALRVTSASDGTLDFGKERPQFLLASDSIALPYTVVHDFPETHLRLYSVPSATGAK
jgi:hypothetical protein